MFNNGKKRVIALATTAIFCFSSATAIYAQSTTKTLKAIFSGIRISYNGQVKTSDKEPFIVDNTTYVPIRMVGELVGKTVSWDGVNKQILITDNGSSSPDQSQQISNLTAQLAQKDIELIRLKQEKEALEQQLTKQKEEENRTLDLDELENQLLDDYDEYEQVGFDINLSGDKDRIDLEIETDLRDYSRDWSRLSQNDIEDYIEDICRDIWDAYDDADIKGYIYDKDSRDDLVTFESDSRQRLDYDFQNDIDLYDLEYQVDRNYRNYFSGIRFANITLDGDSRSISFRVNIDYDTYGSGWKSLSDSEIEHFMDRIYSDIEHEVPNADIEGYVYTTGSSVKIASYWFRSSGNVDFFRDSAY